MDIFITGFLSGIVSIIAIGVFIWSIRRGKKSAPGSLKERTDTNNTDIRSGLDRLRDNNKETGRILDEAENTAGEGLKTVRTTRKSISDIINNSIGDGKEESEG